MSEGSSGPSRGLLDTSTVILLGRLADASVLPDEPLVAAVTLAELAVGPLVAADEDERASARPTSSRPRPISSRCPSTPPRRGPSAP